MNTLVRICVNGVSRYRPREYDTEDGPWDPITGATSAIMGTMGSMMMGVADLPVEILRALHIKPSHPTAETHSHTASRSSLSDAQSDSQRPSSMLTTSTENAALSPSSSQSSLTSPSMTPGNPESTSISSQSLDGARSNTNKEPSSLSKQQSAGSARSWSRGMSMAQTMGERKSRSRSRSRSRSSFDKSTNRSLSESRSENISLDSAVGAGKGLGRIVGAGLKSPMDFTLSLARGFHNAPKLYGDDMVRHPDKVTGIRTGLKAAGKVQMSNRFI